MKGMKIASQTIELLQQIRSLSTTPSPRIRVQQDDADAVFVQVLADRGQEWKSVVDPQCDESILCVERANRPVDDGPDGKASGRTTPFCLAQATAHLALLTRKARVHDVQGQAKRAQNSGRQA